MISVPRIGLVADFFIWFSKMGLKRNYRNRRNHSLEPSSNRLKTPKRHSGHDFKESIISLKQIRLVNESSPRPQNPLISWDDGTDDKSVYRSRPIETVRYEMPPPSPVAVDNRLKLSYMCRVKSFVILVMGIFLLQKKKMNKRNSGRTFFLSAAIFVEVTLILQNVDKSSS